MVLASLLVLAAWAGLAVVFCGIGVAGCGLLGITRRLSFWVGLVATIGFLQLWHFLWPVDGRALLMVTAAGLGGLWRSRALVRRAGQKARRNLPALALIALAALWLSNRALMPPQNGDTAQYFLQAVRWSSGWPIVPGLGNLDGRLGFNQTYFLYVALLDVGPFAHRSHHLANGLLGVMLMAEAFWAAGRAFTGRKIAPDALLALLLFPAVLDVLLGPNLSSPAADLLAWALGIPLMSLVIRSCARPNHVSSLGAVCAFAAAGITIKLSFVGLAAPAVAFAALRCRLPRRTFVQAGLLAAIFLVPWLARGLVLTGYPVFPSTLWGIAFDWQVPQATTVDLASYIRAWGRRPGVSYSKVLGNTDWITPWLGTLSFQIRDVLLPIVIGIGALGMASFGKARPRLPLAQVLVPLVSLGFWALTSPDVRFAGASFWLLAAVSTLCALDRWRMLAASSAARWVAGIAAGLAAVSLLGAAPLFFSGPPMAPVPRPELTRVDGLGVSSGPCWDAEPPCVARKNPGLRRRDDQDLGRGFRTDPSADPFLPYAR